MFTLRYPATGPITSSVELRSPEIGDSQQVTTEGVVRRTRAGELLGVRDNAWPQTQNNVYNFKTLTAAQKNELLTFLQDYAGLEIVIVDHLDQSWAGIISTPENEIIVVKDSCSYDASFEFLGSKI